MWLQGAFCALSSIMLAIGLASIYFVLRNTTITLAGYFRYDFIVMICFVVIVNGYCLVINLLQLRNTSKRKNLSNYRLPAIPVEGPDAPAIIFAKGGGNFMHTFSSGQLQWPKTLVETVKELPNERYFLINRSHIVHWGIISHFEPNDSNTLKLFLYAPFEQKQLNVAQRRMVDFKEWFQRDNAAGKG